MKLTLQAIADAGMGGQLQRPTALSEAVYRLYMCPRNLAEPTPRVVILAAEADWQRIEGSRRAVSIDLDADNACQLLWNALTVGGQRIGEVATVVSPRPSDYVFHREGDRYRVSLPVSEPGERAVAHAA